jgi:PhnB protein
MQSSHATFFAPHLAISILRPAIEFYQKAFDAIVLNTWDNADGSVHVAEMEIEGALFHLHEETPTSKQLNPETVIATTVLIGLIYSRS